MDNELRGVDALEKHLKEHRGSQKELAEYLGISATAVNNWVSKLGQIPAKHVPAVSRFTDIPRRILRPDLYERG
jgi:DNA-binding transcriptional regulator YdaS (Cro superfamily)